MLLEKHVWNSPCGRELEIELRKSSSRESGRRIVVFENGEQVLDTGERFDAANAMNEFELWWKNSSKPPTN